MSYADYDDDVPSASELAEGYDSLGHDWQDAGDLRRGPGDYEFAGRFGECNNCGKLTRDPSKETTPCPA